MVLIVLDEMDVEGVAIDLLSRNGGNVDESCEASTSGNAISSTLEHFATLGEPQNGMEFESKEAAYYFYREYARSVGFGITIKASRRSKRSGKFIDVKIACSRFGTKRESTAAIINPRSCPKTGCKAGLHMKRKEDEKWVIVSFVKEHNHEICPDDFYASIPEMVNPLDDGFTECFRDCVDGAWTDEQFERSWSEMVDKFELNENEWLHSLFRDRRKWVPRYFHGLSFAGLSGVERSGSVVSHFDKYMNSEATFSGFFEEYTKFLQYRYDVEANDDNDSQSKEPTLRSSLAFEKQLSLIYTDAAFKKFQAEVLGVVSCQLQKEREDETTAIFRVEDFEKRRSFFVSVNKEVLDVCCSCYLFEYQGFLCKHAMIVLQNSDVSCIPSQYILKRWSKKGNNREEKHEEGAAVDNRMARFDHLCKRFVKLGEVASLSDEAYKTALQFLEKNLKKCFSLNNSPKFPSEPGLENEGMLDSASKLSKKKKTQKKRKAYNGPEDVTNGSEELRQEPEQVSSRAPTFENCYIPQAADMEATELGSHAAPLGIYYSTQQTIGVGFNCASFSSVSSGQEGYYGYPATIQAMGNLHSVHGRMNQYETQPSIQGAFQGQTGFRGSAIRGGYDMEETLHDMTMESSQFQGSGPSHPGDHRLSH
ncbi:hypothetical protein HID58_017829 [Brassica napus]|uniref:Protein FAR1-RELATED SEQUENCE n=1 Tax=Brassica napus TaxID=3708 RepID=A0ABQ8D870_BRANA|nr:hypothetical protein HID58_017829 [Brassica napus]